MEYDEELIYDSKKRKKGIMNTSEYKSEIIKKSRVKLVEYKNWNGTVVPAKKQGESCKCKKGCYTKITEEERNQIFEKFVSFNTKNEQDSYLQSLISITNVKQRRRRVPESESSKPSRGCTYIYEISTTSGKYKVCKNAFCSLHAVTAERIRRLCILLSSGKSPIDKRGKCTPGNAKSGVTIDCVKEHISSFPVKIAHYTSREYKYLSEKLNVKLMHDLFKEKYPEHDVKYGFYLKIFHEEFSLTFGRPQVDTCCKCEELNIRITSPILNDVAKRVAIGEKMVHLRRAKKFSSKMKEITELTQSDTKIGGICIDYMQNLQLPHIPVQEIFYLRQLTVSVFCIHDLRDGTAMFFIYHEGIARKGANEVCSFILEYMNMKMKNVEHLHIFSDGCVGQNKNHTAIRLMSALVSLDRFKTINQFFPIRGHSFLPCDRDFAVLKRKIRQADRIYTVKEYVELIVNSSNKNLFLVCMPETSSIFDFNKWWPQYYKKNMISIETSRKSVARDKKVSFKVSMFNHFFHSNLAPGLVVAKEFIDGLTQHTFRLVNSSKREIALSTYKQAYPDGQVPINIKKKEDLLKLKKYLPHNVLKFYNNIFKWPSCSE